MIGHVPPDLGSPSPTETSIVSEPIFSFGPLFGSRCFRAAIRWIVLIAAVAIGFHQTLANFYVLSVNGDPGAYRILLPLVMVMCIMGVTRRPVARVRVFDRNLDAFMAGLLAVIGLSIRVLLTPRLGETNAIWGLPMMLLGLYIMIGVIILWGLRTAWRYRLADLLIFGLCPLPFLLVGAELGGTDAVYGSMSVIMIAVYYLFAAGPGRSWFAAAIVAAFGIILVLCLHRLHARGSVTQLVPGALVAIILTSVIIRTGMNHQSSALLQIIGQKMPLSIGLGVVALAGVIFGVVEAGQSTHQPLQAAPAMLPGCRRPPTIAGFTVAARSTIPWAPAYFGPGARWTRAVYVKAPRQSIPAFAIDMVQTARPATLIVYPPELTYENGLAAVQGHSTSVLGVAAQRAFTNSNQVVHVANLSWLQLSMSWRNNNFQGATTERVVISVPQALPGINLLPAPIPPVQSGVFTGAFGRLLASQPTYLIDPAPSVDALAHRVAAEVLTKARAQQGACR